MASDQQIKNRMQVFKNKGKDQDVSLFYHSFCIFNRDYGEFEDIKGYHFVILVFLLLL